MLWNNSLLSKLCHSKCSSSVVFPKRLSRLVPLCAVILVLFYLLAPDTPLLAEWLPQVSNENSFRWRNVPLQNPTESFLRLPSGRTNRLPAVQSTRKISKDLASTQARRQVEVKKAFQKSWAAYKERAWMKDELAPVSGGFKNTFGGWAATLVDTLDTLWIMDMKSDFYEAVKAVATIDFSPGTSTRGSVSLFETNIRHLGGLLSAYDLSHDKRLLRKAIEVGEMLYRGFDTPSRLPVEWFDATSVAAGNLQTANDRMFTAAIGSFSMEFTRLSQLTKDPKYFDVIHRITIMFEEQQNRTTLPGLWPEGGNAQTRVFTDETRYTLGGCTDSFYEYLPKMFAILGGRLPIYQQMYENAITVASKHLFFRPMTPSNADILMSGHANVDGDSISLGEVGEHLTCYVGGFLGLGGKLFNLSEHVALGEKLTDGCVWGYKTVQTGIMPEIYHTIACKDANNCTWDENAYDSAVLAHSGNQEGDTAASIKARDRLPPGMTKVSDPKYQLRPEAIESVFILWRITGREDLLDSAWEMWEAIMKYTSTELANSAIDDVRLEETTKKDEMESFWMAETLKYFYLAFSPADVVSLDKWVFNTEAHPFRRPGA